MCGLILYLDYNLGPQLRESSVLDSIIALTYSVLPVPRDGSTDKVVSSFRQQALNSVPYLLLTSQMISAHYWISQRLTFSCNL